MAFRISSVGCLLVSAEGLLGLGGGGTGPLSTICWGLTFKGRLWVKCERRYEKLTFRLHYNNKVYFTVVAGLFLVVNIQELVLPLETSSLCSCSPAPDNHTSARSQWGQSWLRCGRVKEMYRNVSNSVFYCAFEDFEHLRHAAEVSFVVSRCYNNSPSFPSSRAVKIMVENNNNY